MASSALSTGKPSHVWAHGSSLRRQFPGAGGEGWEKMDTGTAEHGKGRKDWALLNSTMHEND